NGGGGQPGGGDIQGDVPGVVRPGRLGQADLAHDLRPEVKGGAGVAPRLQGQARPEGLPALHGAHAPSAWARSATRSSAFSRPTETRRRPSGARVRSPSMEARCSTRLSGPPRLVARVNRRRRAATSKARARPPGTTKDSMPPAADICFEAT